MGLTRRARLRRVSSRRAWDPVCYSLVRVPVRRTFGRAPAGAEGRRPQRGTGARTRSRAPARCRRVGHRRKKVVRACSSLRP
eukprot:scaffold55617_cov45-Phaeocystis_antarctica.AAC.2